MTKKEEAIKKFEGMNCNQAVLSTFGPDYGVDEKTCLRIGMAFGGGMAHQGKTCGAVTGAYATIGLWTTLNVKDRMELKKATREKVLEYNRLFLEKEESLECKCLLKHDLSIEGEADRVRQLGLFDTVCPRIIGHSVEVLEEILK
jgi:C_GCAxxG_C_C family probable redox protein